MKLTTFARKDKPVLALAFLERFSKKSLLVGKLIRLDLSIEVGGVSTGEAGEGGVLDRVDLEKRRILLFGVTPLDGVRLASDEPDS